MILPAPIITEYHCPLEMYSKFVLPAQSNPEIGQKVAIGQLLIQALLVWLKCMVTHGN